VLLLLQKDRKGYWHAQLAILLSLAYIASQIEPISDGVMFFGQIDGLIVVKFSYALRKTAFDPVVLEECREQSRALLSEGSESYQILLGFLGDLGILVGRPGRISFEKDQQNSTLQALPLLPRSVAAHRTMILDLPGIPATVYLSPLLPGFTGALPALHIGQDSTA
jgi:uncharacterized membrane protein YkvA (DUF1232 family)